MADSEAVYAGEAVLREEMSTVKAQVCAYLGRLPVRCGAASCAAHWHTLLSTTPRLLSAARLTGHAYCRLMLRQSTPSWRLGCARCFAPCMHTDEQTRLHRLTAFLQAMEERCTALAEDQEKLAATNQRLTDENRRLQEVRARCGCTQA